MALNTDEHPRLAGRFGVRGIPALFLLKEGKVVEQMSGAQPLQVILAWFERHA